MEIFACGGHFLALKTTSSALNSQFQSAIKKLSQILTSLLLPVYHVDERPSYITTALLLPNLTESWSLRRSIPANFYYQIVSKPFYEQRLSKFFACGGHLPAHNTTSSALNSQFQSAIKNCLRCQPLLPNRF